MLMWSRTFVISNEIYIMGAARSPGRGAHPGCARVRRECWLWQRILRAPPVVRPKPSLLIQLPREIPAYRYNLAG
jgi:hypothetical protein